MFWNTHSRKCFCKYVGASRSNVFFIPDGNALVRNSMHNGWDRLSEKEINLFWELYNVRQI